MRWIMSRGELLTPDEYYKKQAALRERVKSKLPAPMIISDTMAEIKNPIDGKPYTSKQAYYKTVKEAGCEIMGNDSSLKNPKPPATDPGDVKRDIKRAIDELGD
jgi:hypothetical protein